MYLRDSTDVIVYSIHCIAVTVGFERLLYTAVESSMMLNVTVVLLEGTLDTDVSVEVSVVENPGDLAVGKSCCTS